jgi:hypothetical protein
MTYGAIALDFSTKIAQSKSSKTFTCGRIATKTFAKCFYAVRPLDVGMCAQQAGVTLILVYYAKFTRKRIHFSNGSFSREEAILYVFFMPAVLGVSA